ncbi:MAG: hypothetical protein KDA44_05250 [Planctomycetales bacterium]|nr:hypothetical protein [Planctomycetales bacterium]
MNRLFAIVIALLACAVVAEDVKAYYAPHLGRFLSRDPSAYNRDKSKNLYQYAGSQPVNYSDPEGMAPVASALPIYRPGEPGFGAPPGMPNDSNIEPGDWNRYYPNSPWNTMTFRPSHFDPNGKLCPTDCLQWGNVYNEFFHAWWDQHLEEDEECEWLYKEIREAGARCYTGSETNRYFNWDEDIWLVMTEEAMSESASSWALYTCRAQGNPSSPRPSYGNSAVPPSHNGSDELWEGNPAADRRLCPELYRLLEHAILKGCKR